ncbi:ornithine decarboxylase inhibitor [Malassezia pachydermatis]
MTLQTHTRAIPVTSPPLNRSSSFTLPLSPPPSPPPRYSRARESEAFHGSTTSPAHANVHTSSSTLPLQNVDALRTSLHQVNRFDVPGTPDMSPANGDVHHYPAATAEAFVRRLFVDLPAIGAWKAEDAGIELMCPGWSGAVIEKFSTASSSTSSASLACASEKLNRALYVHMPSGCDRSQLRDHMLAILDTASDAIHASKVVFCLERSLPDLSSLLHGMCYVGGQVISIGGQLDEWVAAHPIPSMVLVAVSL